MLPSRFGGISCGCATQMGKQAPCFREQEATELFYILQCLVFVKINLYTET